MAIKALRRYEIDEHDRPTAYATDEWDRPLAEDEDGNIYADIAMGFFGALEDWHTTTREGEPNYPVKLELPPNSPKF